MTTPLEDALLDKYLTELREQSVSEEVITSLKAAFTAEKLPSPDSLVGAFTKESGGTLP